MSLRLPSRYEDLDSDFRDRLRPNQLLLSEVKKAFASMEMSGGIRFLPIFGKSGSGKSSAAIELGTHLPDLNVHQLSRESVERPEKFLNELRPVIDTSPSGLVVVVDQYEEAVAQKGNIPTEFVERLAILDRNEFRQKKILFLWLTTDQGFQRSLVDATSRNRRILVSQAFEIVGPDKSEWPAIISETFEFHNNDQNLSDYEILVADLERVAQDGDSLGDAIQSLGILLSEYNRQLHDLSTYMVVMLWPVTDGLRIDRVRQFTDPRQGYKLDWASWYRQLNADDSKQLPLREFNRARLYFDIRLVPIAAADIKELCRNLDDPSEKLHQSYLDRFRSTHLFSIVSGNWTPNNYTPLRERDSNRAEGAKSWYESNTKNPTKIGARLAKIFNELGIDAEYEKDVKSNYGRLRADVLINRTPISPANVIIELKAYSARNTMPSTICSAVQTTLRRHAHFAGFLQRQ
ncbi:MAG: hypothetical protein ABGX10_16770 [Paracoccus sp. (in: a-proteobacteria)]|uniref:hypothetical protein n=1 Tax=Paracoccus sp. TaxID=267 RepID=UPI003242BE01